VATVRLCLGKTTMKESDI